MILAIFFVLDSIDAARKPRPSADPADVGPLVSLWGASNVFWISVILVSVFVPAPFREMMMAVAAIGSLWTTARRVYVENHFHYAPIKEVALLFIGIFATMVPALDYLYVNAKSDSFKKYLDTPGQYYFMTGALSSVLDNAPTYLTYLESQLGKTDQVLIDRAKAFAKAPAAPVVTDDLIPTQKLELQHATESLKTYHADALAKGTVTDKEVEVAFLLSHPRLSLYLIAISLGAVFFGAMTYIGNGPNFMVKSIAEHGGGKCPSFFGYIAYYSLPVLLPTFILCWWLFLRG